ncbi:hypothetical protein TGVAND_228175 [Toxoplasma gondii VAND]|uniref:Uncharacterized protein n=1 Tax=Toxoplasma gondii VAND TaxID=933077 RepID=A0A086QJV1_TOXGO|nr:hypothetical protein TGVAND_228175 [Toxoplasma gondii VAND]
MGFRSPKSGDEEEQETEYQQWQGEFEQGKNNRKFESFTGSSSSRGEPASEVIRTQREQTRVSNGGNAPENRMKKSSFTVEFAFGSPPSSAPSPPQLLYLLPVVDSENRYVHLLPTITHVGPFLVVPSGVDAQLGRIPSDVSGTAQETGGSFPELVSLVKSSIVAPVARQRETFQTQPSAIGGSAASNHGTPGVERSANQAGIPFSGFLLPSSLTSGLSYPAVNELQPVHPSQENQFRNTGVTGETADRRDSRLVFHLPPLPPIFGTSLPSSLLHDGGQDVHHLSKTSSYKPTPQQLITLPPVATIISPADSHEVALPPLQFSGPSRSSLLTGTSAEAQEDTLINTLSAPHTDIASSSGRPLATVSAPSSFAQDMPESPSEPLFLTGQETPSTGVTSLNNASALDYTRGPPARADGFFGTDDYRTGSLRQTVHLTPTEIGTAFPLDKYRKYQDSGGLNFAGSNAGNGLEAMTPGQLVELALNHASEAAAQATERENHVMSSISTLLFPHQQDTDKANSQADSRGSWTATQRVLPQLGSLFSILTGLDSDLLWRFFTGSARPPSPTAEIAASVPASPFSSPDVNFLSTSRPVDDPSLSKQWRSHEYDPTASFPMPNVALNPSHETTASRTHARNALQSPVPPLEALKFGLHVEVPDVSADGGLQSHRV